MTTGGLAATVGVGMLCTGVGAPVGVTILAGVLIGVGVGYASDYIKKEWIGY